MVEQWSPKPRAEGSSPSAPAKYADVAQVVAHILGKDEVTSSSLVISSKTVIVFHDDRFCFVQNIRGYVLFGDVSSFSFAKKTLQKVLTSTLGRIIIKIPSILVKNILLYGKKDEGTEYMMNRGRRYGVMAMSSMFIILAVFNMYQGQDNNQILAIFWAYLGYESYGMYTVTHQKKRLLAAAAGVIAGILFAFAYVIHVIAK